MGGERIGEEEESKQSVQKHYIIPDLIRAFLSPTDPPPTLLLSLALLHILSAAEYDQHCVAACFCAILCGDVT